MVQQPQQQSELVIRPLYVWLLVHFTHTHTHQFHRTVSLTSWYVSPPGCEWGGEGSLSLMDGIYNCSSNFMAVFYMCPLLCASVCICVCLCLFPPSPILSDVALAQTVCFPEIYMQSWIQSLDSCVCVCLLACVCLCCLHNGVCCFSIYSIFKLYLT